MLVAEDNSVKRRVLLVQLRGLGYTVDGVTNGREVLATLEKERYDLILMDCQMPEMDGFEATAAIRERWGEEPPVVALTAHAQPEIRAQCLAVGMDDSMTKPIDAERLARVLERWTAGPKPGSPTGAEPGSLSRAHRPGGQEAGP